MTNEEIIKELRKEIDKILQTGKSLRSYRIYQYLDMLEKNNPTFEECIKEWESRGYLCFLSKEPKLLDISNLEEYSVIKIGLENKHYIKVDSVLYSSFVPITFEEHNLIHKTLKALEEMKDE